MSWGDSLKHSHWKRLADAASAAKKAADETMEKALTAARIADMPGRRIDNLWAAQRGSAIGAYAAACESAKLADEMVAAVNSIEVLT